ncbi:hypothetical protein [Aureispira anguillae]|uniref:Uncharacterized protein n=1 Tax=Aureispira anguillae TaxID=2864201 RepID=A0A915YH35_9BACT|nr:hypothetical protein [Aureispira anguillae]BDS12985.1 hypothetical protein AsAng_0037130 [Aureispira anguillae]BDS13048.1 hypothetical protein AsAng_0037760 [Aureispira anguillae]
MPLLIPFLVGASTTGFLWYNSAKEQKAVPTFQEEFFKIAKPLLLIGLAILFFRWLYLRNKQQISETT